MAKCQSLFSGGCFIHMGCLCPCFRAVLFIVKKKAAPHEAAFSPQRNPVPSHPLCPMSSVSAWSTAAAARGATARARHESPVISALQGIFWSPEFLCVCFLLPSRIGEKEHGIPTAAMECLFLYCLGLAGKGLISEALSHDLLPSTI